MMQSLGTSPKLYPYRLPANRNLCTAIDISLKLDWTGVTKTRRQRVVARAAHLDFATWEQALRFVSLHLGSLSEAQTQLLSALTTIADVDVATEAVKTAAQNVSPEAVDAVSNAASQASTKTGPFSFIADGLEAVLKAIDGGLELLHVPYSYGFSIILLTVVVKILTFPLSKSSVESSISMQALQPQIKEIQEKNKNNPEKVQQLTAQLYQKSGVNPLAGCLPTLATIPVFIGLYRALLNAADEGVLKEGFFIIPSLAGPTTIAARAAGSGTSWLFPFKDGAPPIGWHDATAYLILPVLLVMSQYVSQSILQSGRSTDPSQAGTRTFLKVLPLMLGWFSLNVPSGLALYWITNNVLTTGQQIYLKRNMQSPAATGTSDVIDTTASPSGPSTTSAMDDDSVVRARKKEGPTGAEMGARRSSKKGERFRARKAREAAKKAQSQTQISKKKREPFVQEPPDESVAAAFEQELTSTPLQPDQEESPNTSSRQS